MGVRRIFSRTFPNLHEHYFWATFCANMRLPFHDDHFLDDLGAVFIKSKYDVRHFDLYFQTFCPDFHQIKAFRSALASPPPTPLIQLWFNYFRGILPYTLSGRLTKEMQR